jgi:hypothetical protein
MEEVKKRNPRGLGKKQALFLTSIRIPVEVKEFFDAKYPYTKQATMREILTDYVRNQTQGETNGNV